MSPGQDRRLQDLAGDSWWELTDPWHGLETRTGHRERLLVLPSGRIVPVPARRALRELGRPVLRLGAAGEQPRLPRLLATLVAAPLPTSPTTSTAMSSTMPVP